MIITPFAFMAEAGPVIPTSGLVGWYDADDYTSGATWVDRSGNGYDLTLSGTYAKDASTIGGPSVLFSGGVNSRGYTTATIADWTSTTEVTHIEIIRPSATTIFQGSFAIEGTNGVSSFQFDGAGRIYTWKNTARQFLERI